MLREMMSFERVGYGESDTDDPISGFANTDYGMRTAAGPVFELVKTARGA